MSNGDRKRTFGVTTDVEWSRFLVGVLLFSLFAGTACGQEIRIRVLDGRNGRPLSDCLNIRTSPQSQQRSMLLVQSGEEGAAVLNLGTSAVFVSNDSMRCKDVPAVLSVGPAKAIAIFPDYDIDCRPLNKAGIGASGLRFYNVEDILKSGIATTNACGNFQAEPKPGELIVYVRPPHWWEALRR